MKMTSSIALCTYNGAKYLQEQLDSFLIQTRLPDELVVCDDCSTDRTVEIVEAFAKTAPFPVRCFFNEKNIGYIKNFQQAAELCSGDIVFFSDQDDTWRSDKIQAFMEQFESQPEVGIVFSESSERTTTLSEIGIRYFAFPDNFAELINTGRFDILANRQFFWFGHAIAYRRKYNCILYPIPEFDIGHDVWVLSILNSISRCVFLNIPYSVHRAHCESVMNKHSTPSKDTMSGSDGTCVCAQSTKRWRWPFSLPIEQIRQNKYMYWNMGRMAHAFADKILSVPDEFVYKDSIRRAVASTFLSRWRHYENRAQMRNGFFKRGYLPVKELLTGRYFRHSSGFLSFIKDLLNR